LRELQLSQITYLLHSEFLFKHGFFDDKPIEPRERLFYRVEGTEGTPGLQIVDPVDMREHKFFEVSFIRVSVQIYRVLHRSLVLLVHAD